MDWKEGIVDPARKVISRRFLHVLVTRNEDFGSQYQDFAMMDIDGPSLVIKFTMIRFLSVRPSATPPKKKTNARWRPWRATAA